MNSSLSRSFLHTLPSVFTHSAECQEFGVEGLRRSQALISPSAKGTFRAPRPFSLKSRRMCTRNAVFQLEDSGSMRVRVHDLFS